MRRFWRKYFPMVRKSWHNWNRERCRKAMLKIPEKSSAPIIVILCPLSTKKLPPRRPQRILPLKLHLSLLLRTSRRPDFSIKCTEKSGLSGRPPPTAKAPCNAAVSQFVGTFKRFTNREIGKNIWQRSFYDHVIRNQQDYEETWKYIEENPRKWFYTHNPR